MLYKDRRDAGQRLAKALDHFRDDDTVVLALPRGGIVLGAEVAMRLRAPLGVVLVRKIGHPDNEEYALGAVAEGGAPVYNEDKNDVSQEWLSRAVAAAHQLNAQRAALYLDKNLLAPKTAGKTVILVDDGIATGLTMETAVKAVLGQRPKRIIVAVPVAPPDCIAKLEKLADEVIVLEDPMEFLGSVGAHYQHFAQVDDEEVKTILRKANESEEDK